MSSTCSFQRYHFQVNRTDGCGDIALSHRLLPNSVDLEPIVAVLEGGHPIFNGIERDRAGDVFLMRFDFTGKVWSHIREKVGRFT